MYQNLVGTFGNHYIKGFYGRLWKAKVMSKKICNFITKNGHFSSLITWKVAKSSG